MEHVFALLDPPKPLPVAVEPVEVLAGWKMPTATCDECGGDCTPVVYLDVDSIGASLDCENAGCLEEYVVEVAWPFVEQKARLSDFERLGFRAV